jgi:hypothetical protein
LISAVNDLSVCILRLRLIFLNSEYQNSDPKTILFSGEQESSGEKGWHLTCAGIRNGLDRPEEFLQELK